VAGPTAGILLAELMTDEERLSVRSVISDLSNHVEGDDFWVQERPFIVTFGPEHENELDDFVAGGLSDMMGWTPKDTIGFAAMCNQQVDHRLLGEICLQCAKSLDGVIDFGGELPARPSHAPGTLYTVPYRGATGHECRYHVGNAQFLAWWLNQPNFRMIK